MRKAYTIMATMISLISFGQYDHYKATTTTFCKYSASTKTHERSDTITDDVEREILLAKDRSEFSIVFPMDSLEIKYTVLRKARLKEGETEYMFYMGSDDEGYPLCLYISADEKKGMLYYYYTDAINSFSKSERMVLKKR